jgi:ribosomal protein S18 acetylase RimI-like enzyme
MWSALSSCQARFALGGAAAKRYPAHVAPFVAFPAEGGAAEPQLEQLVAVGEALYLCDVAPMLSSVWEIADRSSILQMVLAPETTATAAAGPGIALTEADLPAMLQLTALVFPEFFRSGSPQLGAYVGIYQAGKLAAMAGERMRMPGYCEISAVCTHPDFLGRGYAGTLIRQLVNAILERNEVPFLHVGSHNVRAISLYERLGFVTRRTIPLWLLQRLH